MPFDADKFLNQSINAPMSTSTVPVPEGEFKAFVDDGDKAITFREGRTLDNGTELSPQCIVMFSIMDDNLKTQLNRDKILVPLTLWLDVKGDSLDLSDGKNVGLGRLRKALDQNDGVWNPNMMKGKGPVMIKVGQRSDKQDPTIKYAEVTRVAKLS
jgi:hypothetical protein